VQHVKEGGWNLLITWLSRRCGWLGASLVLSNSIDVFGSQKVPLRLITLAFPGNPEGFGELTISQ